MIRKDLLEKLVIDTTFKIFENKELVSNIAEKIIELHKKKIADQSILNILAKEKNDTQKAVDNLIDYMEKGVFNSSIKNRLDDLEIKLDELDTRILKEKSKNKIQVSKEDIIKFIRTTLKKDAKQLLKLLIKKIILFDDKIEIYYNYVETKKKGPDDDNHQDFSFYKDTFETAIDECKIKQQTTELNIDIEAFI